MAITNIGDLNLALTHSTVFVSPVKPEVHFELFLINICKLTNIDLWAYAFDSIKSHSASACSQQQSQHADVKQEYTVLRQNTMISDCLLLPWSLSHM